jgi:hypothetical protein
MHDGKRLVREEYVDFHWHPGMSVKQKQKNIRAIHEVARRQYAVKNPLEVSSKSESELGIALSSFYLKITTAKGQCLTVEAAFQGSKVFERGGPFTDIFGMEPREAKRDERLRHSGRLVRFSFFGREWPLTPKTAFYDWLYINALRSNSELATHVTDYDAFTDIEFNPEKSFNCQARSAAMYCALFHTDKLEFALSSQEAFRSLYGGRVSEPGGNMSRQFVLP